MTQEILTLEQMEHLKELGLTISEASATVYEISETENYCGYSRTIVVTDGYIEKYINKYSSFTLNDILNILPKEINPEVFIHPWYLYIDWQSNKIYYGFNTGNETYRINPTFNIENQSIMDTAYTTLCWVLENNFFNQKDEK